MLIPVEVPILVSSNPSLGNVTVSQNGSQADVVLTQPIKIPAEAINIYVELEFASLWYNTPNILTGVNDTIQLFKAGPASFTCVFPQGLYTLADINSTINTFCVANGFGANAVVFTDSNNLLVCTIQATVIEINFNNMASFLGMPIGNIVGGPYPYVINAIGPAIFNSVNYYLIHCDLIQEGLLYNNQYSSILSDIPIDVSPFEQILYTPINSCRLKANLAGSTISRLKVWVTDDLNRLVNTVGEAFSCRFSINYLLPTVIKDTFGNVIG